MKLTITVLVLIALSSLECLSGEVVDKVAYGFDNRLDVYQLPIDDPFRILTEQSVVAMVSRSLVQHPDENGRFDTLFSRNNYPSSQRLETLFDLCDSQRFLKDPTVALCTGTLIAPDKILTAGYCLDTTSCLSTSFMFGYYVTGRDSEGYPTFPEITADDIYHCDYVLNNYSEEINFAIVYLDRPVNASKFVPVNITTSKLPLKIDSEVTSIGFPSGIPAKIVKDGRVTDPRNDTLDYFFVDIDAFNGFSGAGVFNNDLVEVGILFMGIQDYVSNGSCSVVNVLSSCNETSCGEEAIYAFHATVPVNFSSAFEGTLQCGESTNGTTVGAPNVVGYKSGDRVYEFTLNKTTLIDLNTCGSSFDTILRIYDGEGIVELFVCDDCGYCGTCNICSSLSRITGYFPEGHYYVVLEGYENSEGNYSLELLCYNVDAITLPTEASPTQRPRVPTPAVSPMP